MQSISNGFSRVFGRMARVASVARGGARAAARRIRCGKTIGLGDDMHDVYCLNKEDSYSYVSGVDFNREVSFSCIQPHSGDVEVHTEEETISTAESDNGVLVVSVRTDIGSGYVAVLSAAVVELAASFNHLVSSSGEIDTSPVSGFSGEEAAKMYGKSSVYLNGAIAGLCDTFNHLVSSSGEIDTSPVSGFSGEEAAKMYEKSSVYLNGAIAGLCDTFNHLVSSSGEIDTSPVLGFSGEEAAKMYEKSSVYLNGAIAGLRDTFNHLVSSSGEINRSPVLGFSDEEAAKVYEESLDDLNASIVRLKDTADHLVSSSGDISTSPVYGSTGEESIEGADSQNSDDDVCKEADDKDPETSISQLSPVLDFESLPNDEGISMLNETRKSSLDESGNQTLGLIDTSAGGESPSSHLAITDESDYNEPTSLADEQVETIEDLHSGLCGNDEYIEYPTEECAANYPYQERYEDDESEEVSNDTLYYYSYVLQELNVRLKSHRSGLKEVPRVKMRLGNRYHISEVNHGRYTCGL